MVFCDYKNVFGAPNTGVHQYRLFNIAVIDLVFTVIASFLISKYFSYSFVKVLIFSLLLGVLSHWLFCVDTTVNKFLFPV